jgi:hypothetical protein
MGCIQDREKFGQPLQHQSFHISPSIGLQMTVSMLIYSYSKTLLVDTNAKVVEQEALMSPSVKCHSGHQP